MRSLLSAFIVFAVLAAGAADRPKTRRSDDWFWVSARGKNRAVPRDADWKRLKRLLVSDVVPESDKRRWTVQFLVAYWRSPGVEPAMAKLLVRHVPPCRMREALRALAQGRKWRGGAKAAGDLPGFDGPMPEAKPQPPDPLETLLISKAKEYDAKRAEVQRKQLALLQGTSQDDPAQVRRELTKVLLPLQAQLCKLSDQYAQKFGPLGLRGALARANLIEPLDAAQCP